MSTKIEYAVQMTCNACVEQIKAALDNVPGINNYDIKLEEGSVVVDTTLSSEDVRTRLENTGRKAVIKGLAGLMAAVAVIGEHTGKVNGVVRFTQIDNDTCIIDGTVDNLPQGKIQLSIHECGDLSDGCSSVGNTFNPSHYDGERLYGDLGNVEAGENGRSSFRKTDKVVKLGDVIGRSLVLKSLKNENSIFCGIIARSSGLFENPKMVCACDRVSIWDERKNYKSGL